MLKTIKTKQHHIIMREVVIKICHEKQNEWRMIHQKIHNISKEIIFFISVGKNFLLIGEKIANFWKGEPPNIGCI